MIHINRYLFCKVLAESEQMRKEADDVGPKAELDHWKKRMAKFNSLLDQIKGAECKAVVGVLHAAKSKLLKVCFAFYSVQKRRVDDRGLYRVILVLLRSKP